MSKKLTREEFIEKSKQVHRDKYDYSLVEYINNKVKVKLICLEHGEFEQRPDNHIKLAQGCPGCKRDNHIKRLTKDFDDFYRKATEKFGTLFLYDEDLFEGFSCKTKIICKKHGEFFQTPYRHITTMNGCSKCAVEERTKLPEHLRAFVKKIKGTIQQSYIRNNFTKKSRTYEILGCTWQEFKEHLENNIYGFKIEDEGLDLDHIIPLSSAECEEDVIRINHYTNFQLLPSKYNRNIKRAKPFNKKHFEKWLNNKK